MPFVPQPPSSPDAQDNDSLSQSSLLPAWNSPIIRRPAASRVNENALGRLMLDKARFSMTVFAYLQYSSDACVIVVVNLAPPPGDATSGDIVF